MVGNAYQVLMKFKTSLDAYTRGKRYRRAMIQVTCTSSDRVSSTKVFVRSPKKRVSPIIPYRGRAATINININKSYSTRYLVPAMTHTRGTTAAAAAAVVVVLVALHLTELTRTLESHAI